jgi:hypothetical protein
MIKITHEEHNHEPSQAHPTHRQAGNSDGDKGISARFIKLVRRLELSCLNSLGSTDFALLPLATWDLYNFSVLSPGITRLITGSHESGGGRLSVSWVDTRLYDRFHVTAIHSRYYICQFDSHRGELFPIYDRSLKPKKFPFLGSLLLGQRW